MKVLAIRGVLALARRDLQIFVSYRSRLVALLIGPVVSVSLFAYISKLVPVGTAGSGSYFEYVVVGIVSLDVLTGALGHMPGALRDELQTGNFERLVTSPLGAVRGLVATAVFPTIQAFVVATVTVLYAALAFDFPIEGPEILLVVPIALLGALAFLPFALVAVAAALAFKQAAGVSALAITGLSFVGGVFFPPRLLPDWLRWTSDAQPLTPALELLRHALVDAPMTMSTSTAVLRLAVFALVLMPIATYGLRAALEYGRRRATVTEY